MGPVTVWFASVVSSATSSPVARSDLEPFFGLATGTLCGFMSAGGCLTLPCSKLLASPGQSQRMLLSELRTFAKRLGSPAQS